MENDFFFYTENAAKAFSQIDVQTAPAETLAQEWCIWCAHRG